jgi:hypothetical protein
MDGSQGTHWSKRYTELECLYPPGDLIMAGGECGKRWTVQRATSNARQEDRLWQTYAQPGCIQRKG